MILVSKKKNQKFKKKCLLRKNEALNEENEEMKKCSKMKKCVLEGLYMYIYI